MINSLEETHIVESKHIRAIGTTTVHNNSKVDSNLWSVHRQPKVRTLYESKEDVIALSVTRKRLDSKTALLTSSIVFDAITQEDRVQAEIIRDYYRKKLTWLNLKNGSQISGFRTELGSLLHSDGKQVTSDSCRIAYRLPDFYEYDIGLETIKAQVTSKPTITRKNQTETLKTIKVLHNASTKANEYWFLTDDNAAKMIAIHVSNPLDPLWRKLFNSSETLVIDSFTSEKMLDGFVFGISTKWSLVD